MKSKTILLFLLFFSICINTYSQIDPNEPVPTTAYPLRLQFPQAYTPEPYGLDAVISSRCF